MRVERSEGVLDAKVGGSVGAVYQEFHGKKTNKQ